MSKLIKIFAILCLVVLTSCARNLDPIEKSEIISKSKEDIKKIDAICKLCKDLIKQNWKDLYLQTIKLRQHNHDVFFNKDRLSEQVNKTINLFLEFADSGQVSSTKS